MKNPFFDFRSVPVTEEEILFERMMWDKQALVQQLLDGYCNLLQGPAEEFVLFIKQSCGLNTFKAMFKSIDLLRPVKRTLAFANQVYDNAFKTVRDIRYEAADIEDLCTVLGFSSELPKNELRPAGVYVSALVNASQSNRIILKIRTLQYPFHFLGFKLPAGKTLIVQGNVGDFAGAGLSGGYLQVEGSARNWCGTAMEKGKILITQDAGQKTGEMMTGGIICVEGPTLGIADSRSAGKIYQMGKLVTSP